MSLTRIKILVLESRPRRTRPRIERTVEVGYHRDRRLDSKSCGIGSCSFRERILMIAACRSNRWAACLESMSINAGSCFWRSYAASIRVQTHSGKIRPAAAAIPVVGVTRALRIRTLSSPQGRRSTLTAGPLKSIRSPTLTSTLHFSP